jgi:hypothetical protein
MRDHEMILLDGIWQCLYCSRRVIADRHQFRVLDPGEFGVSHFGSSGSMTMGLTLDVTRD